MGNTSNIYAIRKGQAVRWLIACSLTLLCMSCSDELTDNSRQPADGVKNEADGYQILKDQPLDIIRSAISGKWQLHYSYGGITGHIRMDYPNSFIDFGSGDSVSRTRDGVLYEQTPITWIKVVDLLGDSTHIIKPYGWGVWGIRNDTLSLYDNSPDGMSHFLTRADDRTYPLN